MNTYIFTTDRGMEIEIDAWFREQAVKDFWFYYDPEVFVRVERLEKWVSTKIEDTIKTKQVNNFIWDEQKLWKIILQTHIIKYMKRKYGTNIKKQILNNQIERAALWVKKTCSGHKNRQPFLCHLCCE